MIDEHKKKWKDQSQQWRWTFRRKDKPMNEKTNHDIFDDKIAILNENIAKLQELVKNITIDRDYWKDQYDDLYSIINPIGDENFR